MKNVLNGKEAGVLILAGGESQRMNYPKPFLHINGKTFIENIVDGYIKGGFEKISIVLNNTLVPFLPESIRAKKIRIIPNKQPEKGRYYSLGLGLEHSLKHDFTFIHNCDNPFVDIKIIKEMYEKRKEGTYVLPVYKGKGGHPVLLSGKIISCIVAKINNFNTLRCALAEFQRIEIKTDSDSVLVNLNTRSEYDHYILNKVPEYSE
jgi:molybdenum cofactor cytidylyltransferase